MNAKKQLIMIDKNWKNKYNENLIMTLKFYSDKGGEINIYDSEVVVNNYHF